MPAALVLLGLACRGDDSGPPVPTGWAPTAGSTRDGGALEVDEPARGDVGDEQATFPAWGDLHAHSGLSNDGCEDVEDDCTARGDRPAENIFARAEANGLHFLAMTDHAEWKGWTDLQTGLTTSIWDGTRELIRRQEDGPTVGILGYEWTSCESDDYSGSHRTILLEDPGACEAWRVPGCAKDDYTSSPKETLA